MAFCRRLNFAYGAHCRLQAFCCVSTYNCISAVFFGYLALRLHRITSEKNDKLVVALFAVAAIVFMSI